MNSFNATSYNTQAARLLSKLTSDFYAQQAQSFSATRQAPWQGWQRCLDSMPAVMAATNLRVLDVGCGNLRFARFLTEQRNIHPTAYYAVDNCIPLVQSGSADRQTTVMAVDVVDSLLDDTLAAQLTMTDCDLVVAFGLMHHVPGMQNRAQLLKTLLDKTKPKGYICVSFWQFMHSAKLAAKAQQTTTQALQQLQLDASVLEEHDYLIGWQNKAHTWRYCHHFTNNELTDALASLGPQVRVCAQFSADGKDKNLNHYLVLQRV